MPDNTGKTGKTGKTISFRIPKKRHAELKKAATDRETTIQGLLEAGIEFVLGVPPDTPISVSVSVPVEHIDDVKDFINTLRIVGGSSHSRQFLEIAKIAFKSIQENADPKNQVKEKGPNGHNGTEG